MYLYFYSNYEFKYLHKTIIILILIVIGRDKVEKIIMDRTYLYRSQNELIKMLTKSNSLGIRTIKEDQKRRWDDKI